MSLGAGVTYGELAGARTRGVALHNMASLPHISVAGAVATATHGSGDANGNLATAVAALELVTSTASCSPRRAATPDFDGMVVGLGALGVVTRVTLDVEPAYEVRQRVFEGLAWDTLFEHFDEIAASGYSVSVFTRWGDAVDRCGSRAASTRRAGGRAARPLRRSPGDGRPAPDPRHRSGQLHPAARRAGAWSDRLPYFRMGFTPSSGEEIQ